MRDLLAGLARFRSPEFEALLTGFNAIATRLCNEFERILDEARSIHEAAALKFPRPDEGGGSNLAKFPRMAGNSL